MREDQGTNSLIGLNRWRGAGSELRGAMGWERPWDRSMADQEGPQLPGARSWGLPHGREAFQGTAAGLQASRAVLTRRLWRGAGWMGPRGPEQLQKAHVLCCLQWWTWEIMWTSAWR